MRILPSHFVSDKLPFDQGCSWTLTTRLGMMLQDAEARFGQRDLSYTFLGIEFHGEIPHVWYPGNCKHVAIRLGLPALEDALRVHYQLAHECIHLLAPSGGIGAPAIEEGLATVFAEDYIFREHQVKNYTDLDSYRDAASLVRTLLSTYPTAIADLRKVEPSFKRMTPTTFERAGLLLDQAMIHSLLEPFQQ